MPLLYLFILSVVYNDFRLKTVHLLHALVFLLYNIILVPNYYLLDNEAKLIFVNSAEFHSSLESKLNYLLLHLQEITYLVLSFYIILRYRKLLLENYASASMMNFRWLLTFITLVTIYTLLALAKNLFLLIGVQNVYAYLLVFTALAMLICLSWIVIRALQSPEFFRGIDSRLQLVRSLVDAESDSNEHSPKTISRIARLKEYMIGQKPYLDAGLTLHQLARQLNMEDRDLSVLINRVLKKHFFDFVNSYRIEHAMKLLRDPDNKELTILEVLYDVGFNSKSSFNTAFKKHTSQTPSDYRKSTVYQ